VSYPPPQKPHYQGQHHASSSPPPHKPYYNVRPSNKSALFLYQFISQFARAKI
jgi:hypothetical protein